GKPLLHPGQRLHHLGIGKRRLAAHDVLVEVGAAGRQDVVLEQHLDLPVAPLGGERQRTRNPLRFQAAQRRGQLFGRLRWANALAIEQLLVVPERIAAMDVHRDGPDLAVRADDVLEILGNLAVPSLGVPDAGDGLHLVGLHPAGDQLLAGVHLETVRRPPALHAGGQHSLCRRTGATGHRRVRDRHARISLLINVEHLLQSVLLTRTGPPAEDLELAGPGGASRAGCAAGRKEVRQAETQYHAPGRFSRSADKLTPSPSLVPHLVPPLDASLSSCQAAARVYFEAPLDDKNRTSALTL